MIKASCRVLPASLVSTALILACYNTLAQQLSPGTMDWSRRIPTLGTPNYSITFPDWFTMANLVNSSSYSTPDTLMLVSDVYRDPSTGFLGFDFSLSIQRSFGPVPPPVTSLSLDTSLHPWQGIDIQSVGAIGNGISTAGTGASGWTDGDPIFFSRDTAANGAGVTVQFLDVDVLLGNLGTSINPGNRSADFFLTTDATSYTSGSFLVFSGSPSQEPLVGFTPAVPEPSVPSLAAVGVAILVIRARSRNRSLLGE